MARLRPSLVLAAGCLAVIPGSAAAAVRSGRYLGDQGLDGVPRAALQVAPGGRTLARGRHGSYIDCFEGRHYVIHQPRSVRISRGRFRLAQRGRTGTLSLRGSFSAGGALRIRYRARPRSSCSPAAFTLHRKARLPFSGCSSQPAKTLVRSDSGRVFEQSRVGSRADPFLFTPVVFGCLYSVNRRFELAENKLSGGGGAESVALVRLAAPYAGFAHTGCGSIACGHSLKVVDLRTGKTARFPAVGPDLLSFAASDLTLKDDSSIAWIASDSGTRPGRREVWADDVLGTRRLDDGATIDPTSLELDGSTISWRHGSETRTAPLG